MISIASTFNDLIENDAKSFDCLEIASNINNIKTNKVIAIRIDLSQPINIDHILEKLKEKNCFNIILDNTTFENVKIFIKDNEKKLKGIGISIIANGNIAKLIEYAQENSISYIFDPSLFDDSMEAFKKLKKRISFIFLNEKDNYGYNTMCGTTLKSKNLIKYIVKKNIDSILVINSNMNEYLNVRRLYLKMNIFKKLLPTKINKSIKVFNYMIDNKLDISLVDFNKLEYKYIKCLIEK